MLAFAAVLLCWVGYNELIERQKFYEPNLMAFAFLGGLLFVGVKWVREGWEVLSSSFVSQKRRGRKKKVSKRNPSVDS